MMVVGAVFIEITTAFYQAKVVSLASVAPLMIASKAKRVACVMN